MKHLFFLFLCCLTFSTSAQNTIGILQKALQTSNLSLIAPYAATDLEVSLPNNQTAYDKGDAMVLLNSFLLRNEPRSFAIKHNCTAPNGSQSVTGTLVTSAGNYRVSAMMRSGTIEEITIE